MADRLPLTLQVYRGLSFALTPLAPLILRDRLRRGKEEPGRLRERRGETAAVRPPGPLVWVHGASVGEILAVIPLIEHIRSRQCRVLVTSGTVTSARLAVRRLPGDVIHQFVPFDAPRYVARFLDHWRPDLALFAESDLWPNLILASAGRRIPLILVNARLSERSFKRWRYFPGAIAALLQRFDLCLAQAQGDAERLAELGAPRVSTTGNLKLDVPAPPVDAVVLAKLKAAIGQRPIIAATSTHPGEEATLIDAHQRLRQSFAGLLTIIAPRHPERGGAIFELARASGLKAVLRSSGAPLGADTDLYVVDTLGELGLVYRLAPIVFIGGSLVSHGGQNPIEAAKLGAAILHGPHVANFAEIYLALDTAHGAEQIPDAVGLARGLSAWLRDAVTRQAVAEAARRTVDALCGALGRTLSALDPYLAELRADRRSRDA